jgi:hypothetical protein
MPLDNIQTRKYSSIEVTKETVSAIAVRSNQQTNSVLFVGMMKMRENNEDHAK